MHRTQNPTSSAADTDNRSVVTPADILRGAARYLEEHGWHRGAYYDTTTDKPFPPADVVGAKLLGFQVQAVRHLWEAGRLGVGETEIECRELA